MTESLSDRQIEEVLRLGAWRDEGRLFAVGLNGEVFKYEDDYEEHQDGSRQWRAPSAPASPPAPPTPGASAHSEPAGADRSQTLIDKYLGFRPEILRYYPSAYFSEVDRGLWITATILPLGKTGPRYWVCLFLADDPRFSPKAFAFDRLSPVPRAVGPRHTNFPDRSICAFTDEDDAWRPGDSPKVLLNLYAEWLLCQLFLHFEKRWPGRQTGLDAAYRQQEFDLREWCDCGSGARYGQCHYEIDAAEVQKLKVSGAYERLAARVVPLTVVGFAKSRWSKLPDLRQLPLHRYAGKPPAY